MGVSQKLAAQTLSNCAICPETGKSYLLFFFVLVFVIFILMDIIFVLVHLHLDGHLCYFDDHGYIIFTLISFLILASIFIKTWHFPWLLVVSAMVIVWSSCEVDEVHTLTPKKTLSLEFLRFRSASSKFCNIKRPENI